MTKKAQIIHINHFASQVINPHRHHLAHKSSETGSWEWLLCHFGRPSFSQRLIQWVFAHPVTLIEPQSRRPGEVAFEKQSIPLAEILRRENLRREDLLKVWKKTFVGPYCSLLKHLQNQRAAIRMASMMWFSPILSDAFDFQELFQSYCDFVLVVSSLFDDFRAHPKLTVTQMHAIADQLWSVEVSVPVFAQALSAGESSDLIKAGVSKMVLSLPQQSILKERFYDVIGTCLAFMPMESDLACGDQANGADHIQPVLQWLSAILCSALGDWVCPVNRYETAFGARNPQMIYGDFGTFLEYRAMDACLRRALHI